MTLLCQCIEHCFKQDGPDTLKDSMPGSLYSDLARLYEKAVQFPDGGNITILAVTTLSGGDITHAIPDNTGYITEGQLFLRRASEVNKVIIDPFRSLSRLKTACHRQINQG